MDRLWIRGVLLLVDLEHVQLAVELDKTKVLGATDWVHHTDKIVLAVQQTDADDDGRFKLLAKCISPEDDDVKVFVISQDGKYKSKRILSSEHMRDINIKTQ